jgi:hypothetical protein
MIKEIDHELAFAAPTHVGALVNITDVNENRVRVLPSPSADLRDASRQPAHIEISIVIRCRQNMTVQISRVQDRYAHGVGIERRRRTRQTWNGAD